MYEQDLFGYDTTGVEPMSPGGGYEVFEAGSYPAEIINAVPKATKSGTGSFLELTYQFLECDLAGKKFISRLNLQNPNQKAVEIAARELKSLKMALGLPDTEGRPEYFLNRPVVLTLSCENRKDDPSKKENSIKAILPFGVDTAPQAMPYQAQPQQQPRVVYQSPQPQPQGYVAQTAQPQARPAPAAYQPQAGAPAPWKRTGTR